MYPVNTDYASVSPCRRIILQNLIKQKLSFDHGLWRQILSKYEIKKTIVQWSGLWLDKLKSVGISEVWELVQNLSEQLNTSPSLLSSLSLRLSKWGKRIIGQKNPVLGDIVLEFLIKKIMRSPTRSSKGARFAVENFFSKQFISRYWAVTVIDPSPWLFQL